MKNFRKPKRKYLIDSRIITGLNLTLDQKKIKKNCKLLDINISNIQSKISKINNVSILTVGCGDNKFLQFEVNPNLNMEELDNIDNSLINSELKTIIKKSFILIQNNLLDSFGMEFTIE